MNQTAGVQFSAQQTEALRLDRDIIVSAAAGSGKTRVLVERYVRILCAGAFPESIVAITFTRKAAAEMVQRIRARLDEILSLGDDGHFAPDVLQHLRNVRLLMPGARISTIHAFCASLLRDFPLEAGVSPNFRELGAADIARIRETAIDAVVARWWQSDEKKHKGREVFFAVGQRYIVSLLHSLTADAYTLEECRTISTMSEGDYQRNVHEVFTRTLLRDINGRLDEVRAMCNQAGSYSLNPTITQWVQDLCSWIESWDAVFAQVSTPSHMYDLLTCCHKFPEFSSRKPSGKSPDINFAGELVDCTRALVKKFPFGLGTSLEDDRQVRDFVAIVMDLARDVHVEMASRKAAMNGLDFDDLQWHALRLFDINEVAAFVRSSISHIMIDEFQDTNAMQYSLLRKLAPTDIPPSLRPNLFIVGDVKQSIYGFRNADVRVFARAEDDIVRAHHVSDQSASIIEHGSSVHLSASYRMAPAIADLVNALCAPAFEHDPGEYDVPYEALVCARDASTVVQSVCKLLVGVKSTQNDDDATLYVTQDVLVAQAIRRAIADGVEVYDKERKVKRALRYSDIAVLCRAAEPLRVLERALLAESIPFVRHAGRGFYGTDEVSDVLSLLRCAVHTRDDASLCSLLRSPAFAVNDATLYAVMHDARMRKAMVWDYLCEHCVGEHADPVLRRSVRLLRFLFTQSQLRTASDVIILFLRHTEWNARIEYLEHRSEQARRNMEKLISVVREIEGAGFRHLYEVVLELERRAEHEDNESEAAVVDANDDAVNLMTIHASKGLEFPLVIVYALDKKTVTSAQPFYVHDTLGCVAAPPKDENGNPRGLLFATAKHCESAQDEAETKRLLYVALTRAQDHLMMSLDVRSNSQPIDWPTTGFAGLLSSIAPPLLSHGTPWRIHSRMRDEDIDPINVEHSGEVAMDVVMMADSRQSESTVTLQTSNHAVFDLNPIITHPFGEVFSASALMLFDQDAHEYYRRYRLGLSMSDFYHDDRNDESKQQTSGEDETRISQLSAASFGVLFHTIMERIPEWYGEGADKELRSVIDECAKSIDADELLLHTVEQHCRNAVEVMQRHGLRRDDILYREHTLMMCVERNYVQGTCDIVVRAKDGGIEVWDWKTNELSSTTASAMAQRYKMQLTLYCYLAALSNPHVEGIRGRLVFTQTAEEDFMELRREDIPAFEGRLRVMIHEMQNMV